MTFSDAGSTPVASTNYDVEVHPGLIVLRESGLIRDEQWDPIKPVVRQAEGAEDPDFLLNKLIEVGGIGQFEIRAIPKS